MITLIKYCSYFSLGCFGAMTIIPNVAIGDNGTLYTLRASKLALCGSGCMILSGITHLPMVGILGVGLQCFALTLLTLNS
jgi:hypothetical protein